MTTTTPPEPAEGSQPSTAKQRYWWVVGTAAATTVALLLGMWWADGLVLWLGIAVVAGGYFFVIGVPSSVAVAISNRWWVRLASAAVIVCAAFWVGWTTGTSEDAQAGLIVLTLPMVGVPLAGLVLVAEQVHAARSQPWGGKSSEVDVEVVELPPRLAAFLIDAVLVFAVQIVPGDLLQDRELDNVAWALPFALGVSYLALCWSLVGATVGQRLVRLRVVTESGEPIGPVRSWVRAIGLVVEIAGSILMFLAPLALIDLAWASSALPTSLDRWTRTRVIAAR